MSHRRTLLLLFALLVAALMVRSLGFLVRDSGMASRVTGGTPGENGRVPSLVGWEMTAGETFQLDVLFVSETATEIYLGFSLEGDALDVSDLFGEDAVLGVKLRRTPDRRPGFAPVIPIGTGSPWFRLEGSVPERFAGRTLHLQAFVEDAHAVGGFALSDPLELPVRHPDEKIIRYVDPVRGDDDGPGSKALPWRTLQDSMSRLEWGDELVVRGGIYRESVVMKQSGLPGYPITVRAADGESPILSGCAVIDGFQPLVGEPGYSTEINYAPVGVYVDGIRLANADSSALDLDPGTYRYRGGGLDLRLPGDDDPSGHQIEAIERDRGLWLKEVDWVVIDGLSIVGTKEQGLWVDQCEAIKLVNVHVTDALTNHGIQVLQTNDVWIEASSASGCGDLITHHAGIHIGEWSERVRILNTEAARNVLLGISLYRVRDGLVYGCTVHDNIEGIIIEEAPSSWIVNCEAYANRNGIGTDGNRVDCPGMRVEHCTSHHNGGNGFTNFENPAGSYFYRNFSFENGSPWGNGFWIFQSTGDTYLHNTSVGNTGSGFALEGGSGDLLLANNVAFGNANAQLTILPESVAHASPMASIRNLFHGGDAGSDVQWGWDYLPLAAFRELTGLDTESLSVDPGLAADEDGVLIPKPGSPCIDAGASFGAPYLGLAPDIGIKEVGE